MHEYSLHANANEHGKDLVLRVTLTAYDENGLAHEPVTWRGHTTVIQVPGSVDTAWVMLIQMCHLLEKNGATGSVRSSFMQPRLFDEE